MHQVEKIGSYKEVKPLICAAMLFPFKYQFIYYLLLFSEELSAN